MRNGFGPYNEFDRYRRRMTIIITLLGIGIAGTTLYYALNIPEGSDLIGTTESAPKIPKGSDRAETELASAYRAVHAAVVARIRPESRSNIQWLERRHEGHLGWYSIEGKVQTGNGEGREKIFDYAAELELNRDDTWKVLKISVKRSS